MPILLDGYNVSRTQRLEDLTTGLGTSLSALAEQVWTENPMSSIFRLSKLNKELIGFDREEDLSELQKQLSDVFRSGTKRRQFKGPKTPVLNKQDADKKVSEAGVKLDIGERGIPEGALDIMIERKRAEVKRKALIAAAPEGFWSGAAQIGTGLAVSLADPINVASAFIPIVGQARYAKLIANTATAVGRTAVRAGVGVTEGLVGAALVEPIVLFAAEAEQADYGLYDSFLNLTFGAVLGGGLHVGLGAIGDAIGRSAPQTKEDLIRAAVGQAMDNKPIDVGFVANTTNLRKEMRLERAVSQGFDTDQVLYHGTNQEIRNFDPTKAGLRGENFGDAVYLTDSPEIASGYSVSLSGSKEFQDLIKDLEGFRQDWFDAVLKFGKDSEQARIKKAIRDNAETKRQNLQSRINKFEDPTEGSNVIPVYAKGRFLEVDAEGKQFRQIHKEAVGRAKTEGFDGVVVKNVIDAATVESSRPSNVTIIFDGRNIESIFSKFGDDELPPPKLDAKSPEASDLSSRQAQETIDKTVDFTPESVDSLTDDILTALDEQEFDTASIRKEIDEINQTAKRDENGLREAIACMLGK